MPKTEKNDIHNGSIRKRSDGRYEGRICINNERKSVYGKNESEVKRKIRDYRNKKATGFINPKNITLNDYIEYWLLNYKLNRIEPSSYDKLERVYENQIKDIIGNKKIGTIKHSDIQSIINNHTFGTNGYKALSYSGLQRIMHLLNPCLKIAVKEKVINDNPCDLVTLPKRDIVEIETKEQFSLSDTEMKELKDIAISYYKNGIIKYRNGIIIMIMLNTGLRVGEMLALEWKDIDFDKRVIYINKTVQSRVKDRSDLKNIITYDRIKKSTKTKNGVRVFPMNDTIISYLNMLIEDNKKKNIVTDYITSTRNGTREVSRNLLRTLNLIQSQTNINQHISLHTLRHTFGSSLIRNKVDISVVSKLMGHANITITYNKYIHVIKEQEAMAMQLNHVI